MYTFTFANATILIWLLPLVLLVIVMRALWQRSIQYRHSLTHVMMKSGWQSSHPYKKIFYVLRAVILLILVFLCAKPRFIDTQSKVPVEGIDIILALDVSGSMFNNDKGESRTRFAIAQDEAIDFINKRTNDAIGLVLFADDVISRCPLTQDKSVLISLIKQINPHELPVNGTKLAHGILVAVNRLKNAQSKSKVIILLTDGSPSPGDIDVAVAIQAAQQYGIKIYTIGIGSKEPVAVRHPLFGVPVDIPPVNTQLLEEIASKTGGRAFLAANSKDMHEIYETIDTLEKSPSQVPIFSRYYDLFIPGILVVMGLLLLEMVLKTFIWFGI